MVRPHTLPRPPQMERFLTIHEDRATEKKRQEGNLFEKTTRYKKKKIHPPLYFKIVPGKAIQTHLICISLFLMVHGYVKMVKPNSISSDRQLFKGVHLSMDGSAAIKNHTGKNTSRQLKNSVVYGSILGDVVKK